MTTTNDFLDELMHTLEDGAAGFTDAAGRLDELSETHTAATFRSLAQQRIVFHGELKRIAVGLGHEPNNDGTIAAKFHRGWMGLKDWMSGDDPSGILQVAEQGESHAVTVFERAAGLITTEALQPTVLRQLASLRVAHDTVAEIRRRDQEQLPQV
jgi:uncharacterized protein (TIGR02284 family)